ncbi:MAG: c-type cytochrome [Thermoguttaceae bacterium]
MNTLDVQPGRRGPGRFLPWLEDRLGLPAGGSRRGASGRQAWWSFWFSLIGFALLVQIATGFVLWMYYSPSAQTAWESVYFVQHEVLGGWLLRGLHFWTAQVLVALLGLYLVQMIARGIYRAPREFVFWTGLGMGLLALALCLTGDLLRWDRNGYEATKTRVDFLMLLPWVGGPLRRLAVGGPEFGHLTLTRFLVFHAACSAGSLVAMFLAHLWVARRALSAPRSQQPPLCSRRCAAWPHGLACLGLLIVVLVFVFRGLLAGNHADKPPGDYLGAELGAPADRDPGNPYGAARPEWSFRGLYGLSNLFAGTWKVVPIFVLPAIFGLLVLAMPLIAHWRAGHLFNLAVLAVLVLGLASFTYQSYVHDAANPDYRAALKAGEEEAQRVRELIRRLGGIPPGGALSLLRNDPMTQGPRLFSQQCAVCHGATVLGAGAASQELSAPNLFQFPRGEWIAGLLDPNQIATAKYFGNTRFAAGVMVRYVQGPFCRLKAEDQQAIIAALSAEAGLYPQAAEDPQQKALVEKGQKLIASSEHCARCHRFYQAGRLGNAPDLTGYGSREWVLGILADPAHPSLYGLRNDRMPAYVQLPARPEANRLLPEQIGLIADWLRGDYYQAPDKQGCCPPAQGPSGPAPVLMVLGMWEARRVKLQEPPAHDPAAEAMALYRQEHCAVCHPHSAAGIQPEHPSAPDLGGFASREWLKGLLDPKQVDGPRYFGQTAFKNGKMVQFVKGNLQETLKDMGKEGQDSLAAVIDALAAEGQRDPRKQAKPPVISEDVRLAFEDLGCADCHPFHPKDTRQAGTAPDLTGYGSRQWLIEIISDPASRRFYGPRNDGMPSYRVFERPEKNLLDQRQVEVLAEWLRSR